MAVNGPWILHFSWGCSNVYFQSQIDFNVDGTFGGQFTGKWVQQDGTLLLSYDGGPAKYGGTIDGNVGSGAMSTFSGFNGCWYLARQGNIGAPVHDAAETAGHRPARDAAGNPR